MKPLTRYQEISTVLPQLLITDFGFTDDNWQFLK